MAHQLTREYRRLIIIAIMAAGLIFGLTPSADAETINTSYHGAGWASTNFHEVTNIGEFYTVADLLGTDWIGYCIDPKQYSGNEYNIITDIGSWQLPYSDPLQTTGAAINAAWLMEQYAPGLDNLQNPGSVNYSASDVKKRINALQIAIWEVVVDPAGPSGYDLSGGSFRLVGSGSSYGSGVNSLAQSYLDALALEQGKPSGVVLSGAYDFIVGQNDTKQDILFASVSQGGETPEPGTMLLFASALGAGAYFRRRRQNKAKA